MGALDDSSSEYVQYGAERGDNGGGERYSVGRQSVHEKGLKVGTDILLCCKGIEHDATK